MELVAVSRKPRPAKTFKYKQYVGVAHALQRLGSEVKNVGESLEIIKGQASHGDFPEKYLGHSFVLLLT